MNNPYAAAKKPAPKELFTKPLEDFDDFEPEPTDPEKKEENDEGSSDQMHSQSGFSTGEVFEPITQQQNAPQQNQAPADNDSSPSEPQTTSIAPMSVPLPLWKRLPSNIISYSSAEILTLAEVCQHGMLYRDRSVRTTGVLLHKYIHEKTGEVSLVLQDPLYQLSSAASTKKRTTSGRRISFGTTKLGGENQSSSTKPRPKSLGMTASRNAPSSILSATKKTPILATNVVPQTPFIGLLQHSTPKYRTPGLASGRKRPLSSLKTPQSARETLISSLADHPTSNIWVVVDPNNVPVSTVTTGDLVTVFGIVIIYDPSNCDDKCGGQDGSMSSVVRQLGKTIHEQRSDEQGRFSGDANHADDETSSKVMYIKARILRQDNGANLRLQQEALQVRRKYIWQTYFSSQEADNNSNREEDVQLFPGCGPPPYSRQNTTAGK